MANKHPQFKPGEATGLKSCVESQTPCHFSSHTHTKGRNRPPSPFPLSRCLTLTRLPRLGCSAWSSLKQTQGLAKAGERGTELPSLIATFKSTHSLSPQSFICFTPFVVLFVFMTSHTERASLLQPHPEIKKKKFVNMDSFTCMHFFEKHLLGT